MNETQSLERVREAIRANDRDRAVNLAAQMIRAFPGFQEGLVLFSQIMLEMGRMTLALEWARKGVVLDKTQTRAMLQLSRAYQGAGFLEQAIQAARRAEELVGDVNDDLSSLGTLYFNLGEFEDSIRLHERSVRAEPDNVIYRYNLAISLQAAGDLYRAEAEFLQVLERKPEHVQTWMNLARLRRQTPESNHIEDMKRLLEHSSDWETRMRLCFSLAKEYEDIGEYDRSFQSLSQGSALRREHVPHDIGNELRFVDALIDCFPEGCFDGYRGGYRSREPIFIVGMPRSGTTLTEQILSGHSDVFAAGELRDFPMNLALQAGTREAIEQVSGRQLKRVLRTNAAQLGKRYVEKTRPRTGHTPHFIDKLPRNSHLCGFIHWALPEARIIVLERHPLDVCFSNFKILFNRGYEYSYDLDDLAAYYIAYRRLMDHWAQVIPENRLYRISYEAIVANQEEESRKLVAFCGLDWQDACLEFYRNREGVTTASLAQVRQPIYTTAVARWRHYRDHLQPLARRLEAVGIDCS